MNAGLRYFPLYPRFGDTLSVEWYGAEDENYVFIQLAIAVDDRLVWDSLVNVKEAPVIYVSPVAHFPLTGNPNWHGESAIGTINLLAQRKFRSGYQYTTLASCGVEIQGHIV